MPEAERCAFAKSRSKRENQIGVKKKLPRIGSAAGAETAERERMIFRKDALGGVAGRDRQRQQFGKLAHFFPRARPIDAGADENDRSAGFEQKVHGQFSRAGVHGRRNGIGRRCKAQRFREIRMLKIGRDTEKNRPLPSAGCLTKQRVQQRTELFHTLELDALLGDRLKQSDMFHAVPGRPSAFCRRSGADVRRDDKKGNRLLVSLRDRRDDIGGAAARRDQANGGLLSGAGVAEGDVSRATLVLRIDEPKVRTFGYRIAQSERSVGENAEDVSHVFRAEILYHYFRKVCFGHRKLSSLLDRPH